MAGLPQADSSWRSVSMASFSRRLASPPMMHGIDTAGFGFWVLPPALTIAAKPAKPPDVEFGLRWAGNHPDGEPLTMNRFVTAAFVVRALACLSDPGEAAFMLVAQAGPGVDLSHLKVGQT